MNKLTKSIYQAVRSLQFYTEAELTKAHREYQAGYTEKGILYEQNATALIEILDMVITRRFLTALEFTRVVSEIQGETFIVPTDLQDLLLFANVSKFNCKAEMTEEEMTGLLIQREHWKNSQ